MTSARFVSRRTPSEGGARRLGPDRHSGIPAIRQCLRPEGFSLIEIMVVVSILALAATIAVPHLISWRTHMRLALAAGELRTDLLAARTAAAKENATVTVQFFPATASYSIKHTNLDGNPVVLKEGRFPPGLRIDATDPEHTMAGHKTSFTSRGGADTGTMVLTSSTGKKKKISVSSLGKITLKD